MSSAMLVNKSIGLIDSVKHSTIYQFISKDFFFFCYFLLLLPVKETVNVRWSFRIICMSAAKLASLETAAMNYGFSFPFSLFSIFPFLLVNTAANISPQKKKNTNKKVPTANIFIFIKNVGKIRENEKKKKIPSHRGIKLILKSFGNAVISTTLANSSKLK